MHNDKQLYTRIKHSRWSSTSPLSLHNLNRPFMLRWKQSLARDVIQASSDTTVQTTNRFIMHSASQHTKQPSTSTASSTGTVITWFGNNFLKIVFKCKQLIESLSIWIWPHRGIYGCYRNPNMQHSWFEATRKLKKLS